MVDKKISDLAAAAALAATDTLEIDTGAASQKVTGTQIRTFTLGSVTTTELGYLSGVTSAVQTQLNGKSNTGHTHTLAGITDVTATATEVNYIDGVTSAIQPQLDSKLAIVDNHPVPTGGTTGQVLKKNSNTNYDLVWGTDLTGGGGGISDAVDANNYVRTAGAWVDITSLTFTPEAHTQTLSTISDVTASAAEVNLLDGVTASTAELNIVDGITATTAEINFVDGVTSAVQTQLDARALNTRTISTTAPLSGGGDLSANRTLVFNANNDAGIRVYLTPQTISSTGAQTLSTTHQNSWLYMTNASTTTWTIPPNSTTAFNVGTEIEFWRSNTSVVVTEGAGVTLNGHDGTAAITTTATIDTQHTGFCIKKVDTDTWVAFGRFTSS